MSNQPRPPEASRDREERAERAPAASTRSERSEPQPRERGASEASPAVASNRPDSREHGPEQSRASVAFDRDEWELIVTLPRRVLMAAVAAAPADGRRAAEGIAGIEAIASGLASPSPLVREVVGSIYSESHAEPAELSNDGDVLTVQTLAACRYASEVVTLRCPPEDASAYRDWLTHIAAVVTGVAQGVATPEPTGRVGLAESRFLYALGGVLRP